MAKRRRKAMSKDDIVKKIEKFEKFLKDETDPKMIQGYKDGIAKLKKELESLEGKKEEEDKPAPKAEKKGGKKPAPKAEKKEEKKAPAKKGASKGGKRGKVEVLNTKTVMVDGKEMSMDSQEFCDYLLVQFKERRKKAKASSAKRKTKSVMSKVTTNIEKGVTQAIKAGMKDKKDQIKKNPKQFIGKVEELESATKKFLQSLKGVLGKEYEAKEVTETVSAINSLVAELKKKVEK